MYSMKAHLIRILTEQCSKIDSPGSQIHYNQVKILTLRERKMGWSSGQASFRYITRLIVSSLQALQAASSVEVINAGELLGFILMKLIRSTTAQLTP